MKNKNPLTASLVKLVIVVAVAALVFVAAKTGIFGDGIHTAAAEALNGALAQLSSGGGVAFTFPRLFSAVIAVLAGLLVYLALAVILNLLSHAGRRIRTVSSIVLSLAAWVIGILTVIWVLAVFGINVTAALAGVGIVALVLSFGAQSLVEDVVTGIFIMFEGSFNVGDIVVLDDFRGWVRKIGVRTTSIEDAGGNIKIVNNSDIRNIQNRSEHTSLAVCDIGISYDTDIPAAEEVVNRTLDRMWEQNDGTLLKHPTLGGVQMLGDSAVVLRVFASVEEKNVFSVQRRLNRELKLAFDENNIEIPLPQVVIHSGDKKSE